MCLMGRSYPYAGDRALVAPRHGESTAGSRLGLGSDRSPLPALRVEVHEGREPVHVVGRDRVEVPTPPARLDLEVRAREPAQPGSVAVAQVSRRVQVAARGLADEEDVEALHRLAGEAQVRLELVRGGGLGNGPV